MPERQDKLTIIDVKGYQHLRRLHIINKRFLHLI